MGFKENLKSELEYKGMLVKELAHLSGIKKQTLDNYLSTHNSIPNAELAVKIAKALDTSVEYLITGEKAETKHNENSDISELIAIYKKLPEEKKTALLLIARLL
ncbi:MAG: helix-turn-helix transcriptional regulator [Spirochaetaceae bacterium]|jgi:transcriptional regulator with XRE-family HTH domain|nr:helix-turn-helix transcriptional regulator [Spirochaetaceae bacterium]